jgi:RNA polymerase sigma-70 factor (ECF subfamily)
MGHYPAGVAWHHKGFEKIARPCQFQGLGIRNNNKQISIEEIQEHQHKAKKDSGVKELLEKLDMKKRVVLSLYYFEQLSVPEISLALKIPAGTVKSRLHNARKELKELWQQHIE